MAEEELLRRLLRDCHLLSALTREVLERGYLEAAGARGVSFVQLNLLKYLDTRATRTIGDLMRFMGTSFPAASKAVGRLKKKGLIRTGAHPADRRAQIVALTPAGRSVIARYERVKAARLRRLLSSVPAKETERWCESLERLAELLAQERVLPDDLCLQCGAYYTDSCLVPERRCRVRA